ncbi:GNAT family N-acetyltransferase [Terrisporobacter vanillatitrophus]|uniref:GNAT family N-acetyltransferase n=1 Tax=Terrisporobacter vanillatitrophus TaxID=3058402 RepID=UPI003365D2CD
MFYISKDKDRIQFQNVNDMLGMTYWANNRSEDKIRKSIENSICYGAYLKDNNKQIGFARVVTDYATVYYICDVIVDENYRGNSIGKALMETIVNDKELQDMKGMLVTEDAHGLYEQYGFSKDENIFMCKR